MKFFIVGKQGSGKLEALNILEKMGVKIAREFSNIEANHPNISNIYIDPKYQRYNQDDVEIIFNNKSYMTISPIEENGILDGYKYYRGLDFYSYDNAQVMILSPRQLTTINKELLNDHSVIVWMDNNRTSRIHLHCQENRTHNFVEVEEFESAYDNDFCETVCNFPNSSLIYFNNELPGRVAAIIYAISQYPDLLNAFKEYYCF